jgi:hypothetical protein
MLCTFGNEDLTRTQAREDKQAADDAEDLVYHIMTSPIEPDTAPREIDLRREDGILPLY